MGEHAQQLPGGLALPSPVDAEVSPARCRRGSVQAGFWEANRDGAEAVLGLAH